MDPVFRGVSPGFRVKGTYYFQPKAAINNFWSWIDFDRTKSDFQQLRADGFNTIILMIPWGLFQPEMRPVKYNQTAFDELHRIINLADAHGLKVILRIGSHEYIPSGAAGGRWVAATVLSNNDGVRSREIEFAGDRWTDNVISLDRHWWIVYS